MNENANGLRIMAKVYAIIMVSAGIISCTFFVFNAINYRSFSPYIWEGIVCLISGFFAGFFGYYFFNCIADIAENTTFLRKYQQIKSDQDK